VTDSSGTPQRGTSEEYSGKPDPRLCEGHAQKIYVCNTPILNALVAGLCAAASIPILTHPGSSPGQALLGREKLFMVQV